DNRQVPPESGEQCERVGDQPIRCQFVAPPHHTDAQDRPGVRDIVHGVQPRVFEGPEAMADVIKELLHNPKDRARLGAEARSKIERHHLLGAAARTLSEGLEAIT
ncbi:MAG: glycosyltransferase, partial [Pseudomonadota bacterium]